MGPDAEIVIMDQLPLSKDMTDELETFHKDLSNIMCLTVKSN